MNPKATVRLTERGVRAYLSGSGVGARHRKDWANRTGVLVKFNRDKRIAYVVWSGNRSMDQVVSHILIEVQPEITGVARD